MKPSFITLLFLSLFTWVCAQQQASKLTGEVMGSSPSYDYQRGRSSTTVNTAECAFDGDLSTFYASYQRSNTWVGLDLGSPHVITSVGWSPRNDSQGERRVRLAVFEGANREDFLDAVPLYMPDEDGTIGTMSYADVPVTRAFRYVRYVGPNDARCNVAEVEFYGRKAEEAEVAEDETLYTPTNLPLVVIHVVDSQDPYDKEHDLRMLTTIINPDGTVNVADSGYVRQRGNGSRTFPKKPYRIKWDKKHRVLDAPAKAKKWTLINNYGDKTLMRNILALDLSRRLEMEYTPYCTSVDVMLNGEYKGNYQLSDQVEVNKNRLNIEEMDSTCVAGEELTGGYLVEVDAYAYEETSYFYSYQGNPVTIKHPADDEILPEQYNYIYDYFNQMESALFATNFKDTEKGYRKYLDLDSFLRHFLIGEFAGNTDTYWSTYMHKHRNEAQFHVCPVWDFDLAYDNDNRTYPINNLSDYIYATKGSYAGNMRKFVNRIIKSDASALESLKQLWAELRLNSIICEDSLLAVVDANAENLEASQQLNFKRWNIMNSYVHQNPRLWGSYANEVEHVRDYITKRIAWFDKKLKFDPAAIDEVSESESFGAESLQVYTLDGQWLGHYASMSEAMDQLGHGLYVIANGESRQKVAW